MFILSAFNIGILTMIYVSVLFQCRIQSEYLMMNNVRVDEVVIVV